MFSSLCFSAQLMQSVIFKERNWISVSLDPSMFSPTHFLNLFQNQKSTTHFLAFRSPFLSAVIYTVSKRFTKIMWRGKLTMHKKAPIWDVVSNKPFHAQILCSNDGFSFSWFWIFLCHRKLISLGVVLICILTSEITVLYHVSKWLEYYTTWSI